MGHSWVDKGFTRETIEFTRAIRDPIHGYVRITNVENEIIDSAYFRRLSRVSQMHSAHLVYPGAQYPRKIHCLGAMHISHRMISHIIAGQIGDAREGLGHAITYLDSPVWDFKDDAQVAPFSLGEALEKQGVKNIPPQDVAVYIVQAERLATLLHDLGHGPYSHLYEAGSEDPQTHEKFDHEAMSSKLIEDFLPNKHDKFGGPFLRDCDAKFVAAILRGKENLRPELLFLHDIVSGVLDADKLDYLVRDAHYAGTPEYGTIDLDRIVDSLVVHKGRLCYSTSGLDAVFGALNSMFFMYNNVYLHRTVRGFDRPAVAGLERAHAELRAAAGDVERFVGFDDATFLAWLNENSRKESKFEEAARAMHRLRDREKVLKCVADKRAAIQMVWLKDAKQEPKDVYKLLLKGLEERVQKAASTVLSPEKIQFELEVAKNIRPIGLGIGDVIDLFSRSVFYDSIEKTPKSFLDFEPHYKTMLKIVVPVRVFMNYSEKSKVGDTLRGTLNEQVQTAIDAFERDREKKMGGT